MNTIMKRFPIAVIAAVLLIFTLSCSAQASGIIYYEKEDEHISTDEFYTQYQVLDFVSDSGETYEGVILLADDLFSTINVQFDLDDGSSYELDAVLEDDGTYYVTDGTPYTSYVREILTDALSYGFWFMI